MCSRCDQFERRQWAKQSQMLLELDMFLGWKKETWASMIQRYGQDIQFDKEKFNVGDSLAHKMGLSNVQHGIKIRELALTNGERF